MSTTHIESRIRYFAGRCRDERTAVVHALAEQAGNRAPIRAYAASQGVEVRKSWTVRRLIAETLAAKGL